MRIGFGSSQGEHDIYLSFFTVFHLFCAAESAGKFRLPAYQQPGEAGAAGGDGGCLPGPGRRPSGDAV